MRGRGHARQAVPMGMPGPRSAEQQPPGPAVPAQGAACAEGMGRRSAADMRWHRGDRDPGVAGDEARLPVPASASPPGAAARPAMVWPGACGLHLSELAAVCACRLRTAAGLARLMTCATTTLRRLVVPTAAGWCPRSRSPASRIIGRAPRRGRPCGPGLKVQ